MKLLFSPQASPPSTGHFYGQKIVNKKSVFEFLEKNLWQLFRKLIFIK
jgi:hypothetical protein